MSTPVDESRGSRVWTFSIDGTQGILDFLRLVLLTGNSKWMLHLESSAFRNEVSLSPKGINNPAQGCGAAATLGLKDHDEPHP
ncbi:MAG: hypothetical protein DMG06_02960 [Acidobacteria bacterium]|nr:MAG: hypothetical protein DMG06_02960 [Acidobacteriota bacterium]